MRIIAGKFRGRKLVKSDHFKSLRPTTDKNREALFNILSSSKFFDFSDAKVLDLCCGTGAVAFEALSRGAKSAVLIDNNREHLELAKQNAKLLKAENDVEIICADAKRLSQNSKEFDLIFIDPPYKENCLEILQNLEKNNYLSKKTLIVIENDSVDEGLQNLDFVKLLDVRKYGITYFSFLVKN